MLAPVPDYLRQPPAYFHPRILVGPGAALTPPFVQRRGISHVINCAFPGDSPSWFRDINPTRYVCLRAHDTAQHNILDWYPLFEETLQRFLRETSHGVVYVHCQAGINRSAFLALTYVCRKFYGDGETELMCLKRQRPCMFQNQVYRGQVLNFLNGCLPGAENPGKSVRTASDRDTGLGAQGCGTDRTGVDADPDRASD